MKEVMGDRGVARKRWSNIGRQEKDLQSASNVTKWDDIKLSVLVGKRMYLFSKFYDNK